MAKYKSEDLPIKDNIKIVAGDDFVGELCEHQDENGAAIDFTGYTITGAINTAPDGSGTELAVFSFTRDDLNGKYTPEIDQADTANLAGYTLLYYSIKITDTAGEKQTYWYGDVRVQEVP